MAGLPRMEKGVRLRPDREFAQVQRPALFAAADRRDNGAANQMKLACLPGPPRSRRLESDRPTIASAKKKKKKKKKKKRCVRSVP